MGRVLVAAIILAVGGWGAAAAGNSAAPAAMDTLFGQQRPDSGDVIRLRDNQTVLGTVLNETVTISTPYGLIAIPLRRCAGVSFEGAQANTETVVSVNFNRFTGIVMDRAIHVRIGASGEEVQIRKERVRHILLKQTGEELAFVAPTVRTDLFLMANGDLLTGQPDRELLRLATAFGEAPVFFAEIDQVVMEAGDQPVARITMKNREVLRGRLATEELTIRLDIGVAVESVFRDKFARMFVGDGHAKAAALFGEEASSPGDSPAEGGVRVVGDELVLTIPGPEKVQLRMRLIPPGTYMMGSPASEKGRDIDERLHQVTISKPFYIGVFEVTQAQWAAVMGSNPSHFAGQPNHPVEMVSWDDCQAFIARLNGMGVGSFRLPTEAEWEYAARAGTKTAFYWGEDGIQNIDEYAWYEGNSDRQTQEVGRKRPNLWGLCDMSGNVYEWCHDWMGKYRMGRETDPRGPASGSYRVYRGGGWYTSYLTCRSALRYGAAPSARRANLGLRLVRVAE